MTHGTLAGPSRTGLLQRAATTICPAAERQWVDAMFAELAAIDRPAGRACWVLGAAAIVLAAINARIATTLSLRLRISIAIAFGLALGAAVISYIDVQAALLDDELLAAFSVLAAITLLGLATAAVRNVFSYSEEASTEGRSSACQPDNRSINKESRP